MHSYPTRTLFTGAVCLLSILAVLARADDESHAVQGTTHPVTNASTISDSADSNTQSPPGTVGKNWPAPVDDSQIYHMALFELLEYQAYNAGPPNLAWDFDSWLGGDYNRLWFKTEGEQKLGHESGFQGDFQLLYGRLISPFWDFQVGLRYNRITAPYRGAASRTYAVIGLQGLAKQWFDVEPALYLSNRGEVSLGFTATVDYFLTQRVVLQPRFEAKASIQGDKKFNTASGADETDIGLRVRYEVRREFAPYVGVTWLQRYGGTAASARSEGEPARPIAFVAGVQLSF
jgi:copper resistance protein B